MRKKSAKKRPEEPRRLTFDEIRTLTDKALGSVDNEEQPLAFMLLISEIEMVATVHPANLENITRAVRSQLFYRSGDPMLEAQDRCIEEYRRKFTEGQ